MAEWYECWSYSSEAPITTTAIAAVIWSGGRQAASSVASTLWMDFKRGQDMKLNYLAMIFFLALTQSDRIGSSMALCSGGNQVWFLTNAPSIVAWPLPCAKGDRWFCPERDESNVQIFGPILSLMPLSLAVCSRLQLELYDGASSVVLLVMSI